MNSNKSSNNVRKSEVSSLYEKSLELDNLYNQLEGLANPDDRSVDEKSQQLLVCWNVAFK